MRWLNLASLSEREKDDILARRSLPCSNIARPNRRKMKHSSSVFQGNPWLLLNRCNARSSCLLPPRFCTSRCRSTRNHCSPHLPCLVGLAGLKTARLQLQLSSREKKKSSGDAAEISPFPSSTGLVFRYASRGSPCPHLPTAVGHARVRRDGGTSNGRGLPLLHVHKHAHAHGFWEH